jgi:hypothetical protein
MRACKHVQALELCGPSAEALQHSLDVHAHLWGRCRHVRLAAPPMAAPSSPASPAKRPAPLTRSATHTDAAAAVEGGSGSPTPAAKRARASLAPSPTTSSPAARLDAALARLDRHVDDSVRQLERWHAA